MVGRQESPEEEQNAAGEEEAEEEGQLERLDGEEADFRRRAWEPLTLRTMLSQRRRMRTTEGAVPGTTRATWRWKKALGWSTLQEKEQITSPSSTPLRGPGGLPQKNGALRTGTKIFQRQRFSLPQVWRRFPFLKRASPSLKGKESILQCCSGRLQRPRPQRRRTRPWKRPSPLHCPNHWFSATPNKGVLCPKPPPQPLTLSTVW